MSDYITFNQVLMFKDPDKSSELGQALWSALKEVKAFYNHGTTRADFLRTFLSEFIPDCVNTLRFTGKYLGYRSLCLLDGWKSILFW